MSCSVFTKAAPVAALHDPLGRVEVGRVVM
jgi:hypothetical protein